MKIVYFVTGEPVRAASDLRRLARDPRCTAWRAVIPQELLQTVSSLVPVAPGQVFSCRPFLAPWLWLRLLIFLGLNRRVEVVCRPSRHQHRLLKLLALLLRGRISFPNDDGTQTRLNLFQLCRTRFRQLIAAEGPIGVVGSASAPVLANVVAAVRQRYPGVPLHALLPAPLAGTSAELFDSVEPLASPLGLAYLRLLPHCFGKRRFRRLIVLWTHQGHLALKCVAWWLPLWRVEVYNEQADAFSGRNVRLLLRHWLWRSRQYREKKRQYRQQKRQYRQRRLQQRQIYFQSLPVVVVGSASGFYLKKIVPRLRARFPDAKLHGLLPASLEGPAGNLFDSVTILRPGLPGLLRQACWLLGGRARIQATVVPCANEHYGRVRLLAFALPFPRRLIYNEQGDGFAVRDLRNLAHHVHWRLRDQLWFQVIDGAAGKSIFRLFHLALYAMRLAAGLPLLGQFRWKSWHPLRPKSPVVNSAAPDWRSVGLGNVTVIHATAAVANDGEPLLHQEESRR
ncbi:MAG: hypothetical protein A3H27_07485 [Acidobacteria bacterium RIFCSPLOWO2_02_FULL_59_13]|nr:MAG: hypothetical protein A3H27_07485 [Acidobacteria bacterium RIFCSPLOWO2_02_FULL_59_13]